MASRIHFSGSRKTVDVEGDPRTVVNQLRNSTDWAELKDDRGDTVQVNPQFAFLVEEKRSGSASF